MDNRERIDGPGQGFSVLAYVGIIVGVILAIAKALVWSKGLFTSEVFGYALAGAMKEGAQPKPVCSLVSVTLHLLSSARICEPLNLNWSQLLQNRHYAHRDCSHPTTVSGGKCDVATGEVGGRDAMQGA